MPPIDRADPRDDAAAAGLDAEPWLDGRYYADLEPAAERALRAAGLAWHKEAEAERQLARAAALAPGHLAVLTAHYRYHLYKHRFGAALDDAARLLAAAAGRLDLPPDWRAVHAADADFASPDPPLRFWLFVLQAYGYVLIRLGRTDDGLAALQRVVALDRQDVTHTRILLQVIERAAAPE